MEQYHPLMLDVDASITILQDRLHPAIGENEGTTNGVAFVLY